MSAALVSKSVMGSPRVAMTLVIKASASDTAFAGSSMNWLCCRSHARMYRSRSSCVSARMESFFTRFSRRAVKPVLSFFGQYRPLGLGIIGATLAGRTDVACAFPFQNVLRPFGPVRIVAMNREENSPSLTIPS